MSLINHCADDYSLITCPYWVPINYSLIPYILLCRKTITIFWNFSLLELTLLLFKSLCEWFPVINYTKQRKIVHVRLKCRESSWTHGNPNDLSLICCNLRDSRRAKCNVSHWFDQLMQSMTNQWLKFCSQITNVDRRQ